jgi:hypothetical protein
MGYMKEGILKIGTLAIAAAGLVASVLASPLGAKAGPNPTFNVRQIAANTYGGEPSITSDGNGVIYYDSPSQGLQMWYSLDHGLNWIASTSDPDPVSGDNCLANDQANAIYQCNLNGSQSLGPLQADVWKTVDKGTTWIYGNNPINLGGNNVCGTSCNPFGVDRQWVDATTQSGLSSGQTGSLVGISYHDFSAQSHIYINLSKDGGQTYSPPEDIVANLNPGTTAATVIADTACSTVPAATKIAKGGPHPGRIYVAWIAADPSAVGTGCNFTQAQAFHNLIVAYADPPFTFSTGTGALPPTIQWTGVIAADIGLFHDSSTPFVGFTLDNLGNPYFGYAANALSNPATCSGPSNPQIASCEYDMWVLFSNDGGTTWGSPHMVNSDIGTHFFPAITAADPGHVWVSYLQTPSIIPTDPNGKEHPGSCFTPACTFTGVWNLWASQSTDLLTGNAFNPNPTWATTQITANGMHQGDICNLGIACVPGVSNRNLLDFISETVDPQGCAHISFPDDFSSPNLMKVANETTGCVVPLVANVPESPLTVLLIPAAALAAAGAGIVVRRRRRLRNSK